MNTIVSLIFRLLLLSGVAWAASANALSSSIGPVFVKSEGSGAGSHASGTAAVSFGFENRGVKTAKITFICNSPIRMRRELDLAAGAKAEIPIYLPQASSNGVSGVISVQGEKRQLPFDVSLWKANYHVGYINKKTVAFDRHPFSTQANWSNQNAPRQWQMYAHIDALVVSGQDLLNPQPWHRAVREWVNLGGVLVVDGSFKMRAMQAFVGDSAFRYPYDKIANDTVPINPHIFLGKGYVMALTSPARLQTRIDVLKRSDYYYDHVDLNQYLNAAPVYELFAALLLFTFIVGPLAWLLLIKRRSRPFLFFNTVLGVSLVFSVMVFYLDRVVQGSSARGVSRSITLIDEAADLQVTMADFEVFLPSAAAGDIAVTGDTNVSPVYKEEITPVIDVQQDGMSIRGLLPVRDAERLRFRSAGRVQARLVFDGDYVENHLGEKALIVQLRRGEQWLVAKDVGVGQRAKLEKSSRPPVQYSPPRRTEYFESTSAVRNELGLQGDGVYTAVLAAAPPWVQPFVNGFEEVSTDQLPTRRTFERVHHVMGKVK